MVKAQEFDNPIYGDDEAADKATPQSNVTAERRFKNPIYRAGEDVPESNETGDDMMYSALQPGTTHAHEDEHRLTNPIYGAEIPSGGDDTYSAPQPGHTNERKYNNSIYGEELTNNVYSTTSHVPSNDPADLEQPQYDTTFSEQPQCDTAFSEQPQYDTAFSEQPQYDTAYPAESDAMYDDTVAVVNQEAENNGGAVAQYSVLEDQYDVPN